MAGTDAALGLGRTSNDAVWRHTRAVFLASLGLFLVNIALGFANALTAGPLPRWQVLTHLHAGAIGWITLATVGFAIWLFTGKRDVSDTYARAVGRLGWLSVLALTAYIASIAVAFSEGGDALLLLPVFGTAALVMFWAAAGFALSQLRHQPVVTTPHLLVAGGLLAAGMGATVGVLIGLRHATGIGTATIQSHGAPMLFYLFLVGSAVVELAVNDGEQTPWTWPGVIQAGSLVVGAAVPPAAFLLGFEALLPLMLLLFILFLLVFVGRVGWRALTTNPVRGGIEAWAFFGTLWLVATVGLFLGEVVLESMGGGPDWLLVVLAHAGFVGMMTNLLFGVLSARTHDAPVRAAWAEPGAMWLLNGGLIAFILLEVAIDSPLGSLVMGLGVLLGVAVIGRRLW